MKMKILGDFQILINVPLTVYSYHVTYAFQSESTFYSLLNVKELFAQNRRKSWSLSDCNWTRPHNQLVGKRTLKHLAKQTKWMSCVVTTYLYGAFDCMFLSCHVQVQLRSLEKCISWKKNKKYLWELLDF